MCRSLRCAGCLVGRPAARAGAGDECCGDAPDQLVWRRLRRCRRRRRPRRSASLSIALNPVDPSSHNPCPRLDDPRAMRHPAAPPSPAASTALSCAATTLSITNHPSSTCQEQYVVATGGGIGKPARRRSRAPPGASDRSKRITACDTAVVRVRHELLHRIRLANSSSHPQHVERPLCCAPTARSCEGVHRRAEGTGRVRRRAMSARRAPADSEPRLPRPQPRRQPRDRARVASLDRPR